MATRRLKQLYPIVRRCVQQSDLPSCHFSTQPEFIQVTPKVSLFDQKVHIRVQGLPSKAKVTLQAATQQEWQKKPVVFMSCGHFMTNDNGDLDLNQDASLGGTYTGLAPMGPFWSLMPSPAGARNIRMVVRNGDDPVVYTLSLHLGHLSLSDLAAADSTPQPVYSTSVTRLKKSADVRRVSVKEGSVRGTLFLPAGEGPHPGVIDMFGSAGGLMEIRASLLASHGYAVLALPFFRYDDLPAKLEEVTFDYFEEAVSWFSAHPAVKADGIGVVGVSTGAQFALLMALHCPQDDVTAGCKHSVKADVKVKAVAHINGLHFCALYDLYQKDGQLMQKAVKLDLGKAEVTEEGLALRDGFPSYTQDDILPVWKTSIHVLSIAAGDDHNVKPAFADIFHSMYPEDKRHLVEVVHYPGAGHLLEPPYSPHCRFCANPTFGMDFLWGGNPADHAAAQEDSWNRILTFLRKHLS